MFRRCVVFMLQFMITVSSYVKCCWTMILFVFCSPEIRCLTHEILFRCLENDILWTHRLIIERDVAQWLERGALPMSLLAVRFRIPLGAGFSEKYNVYPFSILGHFLRCCVLGQDTSPSNASLDWSENEYLVGQRWQCVR